MPVSASINTRSVLNIPPNWFSKWWQIWNTHHLEAMEEVEEEECEEYTMFNKCCTPWWRRLKLLHNIFCLTWWRQDCTETYEAPKWGNNWTCSILRMGSPHCTYPENNSHLRRLQVNCQLVLYRMECNIERVFISQLKNLKKAMSRWWI